MSWRTNPFTIGLRNILRRLGINRKVASWILSSGYEDHFDRKFSACISSGDCIWDIGANVGYYTLKFVDIIGNAGHVVAFEPSPHNFHRLEEECKGISNVTMQNIGLGSCDERVAFQQGTDDLGATSRIIETGNNLDCVMIRRIQSLLQEGQLRHPNVLKIDVEGYEWEVLQGLGDLVPLGINTLGIEIHFSLLNERSDYNVPALIEKYLIKSGFTISWPDPSHILATRISEKTRR